MRSPRQRCFWPRMTPASSPASSCSSMAAERKSDRRGVGDRHHRCSTFIHLRSRKGLKRNSVRFAASVLAALASLVAGPNASLAAAPQHHDQVPGFYRLKVGDLEVTALYDGTGVFDPQWLNGTKAGIDGVVKALHEDPHVLDVVDTGFLVNTGKQLILVDAGAGAWWGGGVLGRLAGSLRSAGYT